MATQKALSEIYKRHCALAEQPINTSNVKQRYVLGIGELRRINDKMVFITSGECSLSKSNKKIGK